MGHTLTQHRNISISLPHGHEIAVMYARCPAGESTIQLAAAGWSLQKCDILFRFESNSDLFDLALVVDAIRQHNFDAIIHLQMPYFPYARQDRVCNPGEPLSAKVAATFINSLRLASVKCYDLHSDVSVALLNKLIHVEQHRVATSFSHLLERDSTLLVSPDAGAEKKTLTFAKAYGYQAVVCAQKTRDPKTGEIVGITLPSYAGPVKNCVLILDDICDGGGTFVALAKRIREDWQFDGRICLYVTHGVFSNGFDAFDGLIDAIYTSNLMGQEPKPHNIVRLTQL